MENYARKFIAGFGESVLSNGPGCSHRMANWFIVLVTVSTGVVACASENEPRVEERIANDQEQTVALGTPSKGFEYAKKACASCHAVEVGQLRSPNPLAPTFQSLSDRPDMTRMALSALLQTPHRSMPNLIVESDKVDDLSAYIAMMRADD